MFLLSPAWELCQKFGKWENVCSVKSKGPLLVKNWDEGIRGKLLNSK